ncbi:HNH endonuclease [Enterobacter cancerogenus]|uniref:HNH endonuclease n=1 Tax=Enterobacter cancerogenus TaxID=69218 RepID=UPI0030766C4A
MKLYGGRCRACGVTAQHGVVMLVDHIKPRSKFPHLALEINNLQVLCEDCNKAKSNTDDIKWRQ